MYIQDAGTRLHLVQMLPTCRLQNMLLQGCMHALSLLRVLACRMVEVRYTTLPSWLRNCSGLQSSIVSFAVCQSALARRFLAPEACL
jgi:hypothetical protein